MAKGFALASLIVGGLIAADLWSHYKTTHAVLNFGAKESRYLAGR
jgi:hypothetical protein